MKNSAQSLELFHKGGVRFGDAHPMVEGRPTYPIPFDWHYPKNEGLKGKIYLAHRLSLKDRSELVLQGIQLKQARGKYICKDNNFLEVEQNFSIKSAYDRETFSSKEGQMYGYFHLKKGSQWYAEVHIDPNSESESYAGLIRGSFNGVQRIGRSSSAQYGRIRIEEIPSLSITQTEVKAGKILLYAYSNLCLFDEQGNNTVAPTAEILGLPGSKIIWRESQIRTRIYRTWNKKRNARNTDLNIIEKGSVFSLDVSKTLNSARFEKGIGALRSEGFGQVLINPPFLVPEDPKQRFFPGSKEVGQDYQFSLNKSFVNFSQPANDSFEVLDFLRHRKEKFEGRYDLEKRINAFIKDHGGIFEGVNSSQWGQVRNIARKVTQPEDLRKFLFDEKTGFLHTGSSKNTWRKRGGASILFKNFIQQPEEQKIPFIIKLASEMAKYATISESNTL
ncbi:MAG: hypothetical protein AAF696_07905 [Bacteroidota bacterium]